MESIAEYKSHSLEKIIILSFVMMITFNLISFTIYSGVIPEIFFLKYVTFFSFILSLAASSNVIMNKVKIKHILISHIMLGMMIPSILNTTSNTIGSTILHILISFTIMFSSLYIFPKIGGDLFLKLLKIMFVIIACFVIIPSYILTFNSNYFYYIGYRSRFIGVFNNTNELARFTALGFLIGMRITPFIKRKFNKAIIFSLMIVSIYIIYLTDSRASLLLCLISGVLFLFVWNYKKGNKRISIFIISILLFVCMFAMLSVKQELGFDKINELSSGRLNIWKDIIINTSNLELIFGSGSNRVGLAATLVVTNGYFEIFIYYGIVGLILWIGLIIYLLFKKLPRNDKMNMISAISSISIIISLLIYYIFEGGIISVGNIAGIYFWLELTQKEI